MVYGIYIGDEILARASDEETAERLVDRIMDFQDDKGIDYEKEPEKIPYSERIDE